MRYDPPFTFYRVDSVLEPWAFELVIGGPLTVTIQDGRNVRKVIADTLHNVQRKVLEVDEGDTKSIFNIVYVSYSRASRPAF